MIYTLPVLVLHIILIEQVSPVKHLNYWVPNRIQETRRKLQKTNVSDESAVNQRSERSLNTTLSSSLLSWRKARDGVRGRTLKHRTAFRAKPYNPRMNSTMMVPKYLRQEDAATETEAPKADESPKDVVQAETTTTESSQDDDIEKLNPYAIIQQMEKLEDAYEDADIFVEKLGRTAEYNDIVLLKVTKKKVFFRGVDKFAEDSVVKKIIFIVHGLTPKGLRIYVQNPSSLVQMETVKMLLGYYFEHLDKFDIYIMPLANPDAALTKAQFWNKNMSPQSSCQGVALDRNFDIQFNPSHNIHPCSQLYPGPYAFSEPETRAVREVFNKYGHKIAAYMHVHYGTTTTNTLKGEAVLFPRGYSEVPLDEDKYVDLRGEIDEAIKNSSLEVVSVVVDSLYNWYGGVNGTSVDYASSIYGIPYTMELVMQQYYDDPYAVTIEQKVSYHALKEIWGKVIKVIFNSIHQYFTSESRRFLGSVD